MTTILAPSQKILTPHLEIRGGTKLSGEVRVSGAKNSALVLMAASLLTADPLGSGIELRRSFDPSIPELLGDGDRLTQVFLNLCRNALQALEGRGRLEISTRMTLEHRISTQIGRAHV